MEINQLPPFPWEWKTFTARSPHEESQGTTIMDRAGYYVSHQLNTRPIEKREEIAAATISAVNETWGKNIRPEAVGDLVEAVRMQQVLIHCLLESKLYKNADETIAFATAALDKAIIKW